MKLYFAILMFWVGWVLEESGDSCFPVYFAKDRGSKTKSPVYFGIDTVIV